LGRGLGKPTVVMRQGGSFLLHGIIIAVVIIGLLIVAINQFFPGFFQNMFSGMQDKLNANW